MQLFRKFEALLKTTHVAHRFHIPVCSEILSCKFYFDYVCSEMIATILAAALRTFHVPSLRTCRKHERGSRGWLTRWPPRPFTNVLCDAVAIFDNIDQASCHCVFIYSHFHWKLITFLHTGFLYCFCLLPESYETVELIKHMGLYLYCISSENTCRGRIYEASIRNRIWPTPKTVKLQTDPQKQSEARKSCCKVV